jgi:hypothetical protein
LALVLVLPLALVLVLPLALVLVLPLALVLVLSLALVLVLSLALVLVLPLVLCLAQYFVALNASDIRRVSVLIERATCICHGSGLAVRLSSKRFTSPFHRPVVRVAVVLRPCPGRFGEGAGGLRCVLRETFGRAFERLSSLRRRKRLVVTDLEALNGPVEVSSSLLGGRSIVWYLVIGSLTVRSPLRGEDGSCGRVGVLPRTSGIGTEAFESIRGYVSSSGGFAHGSCGLLGSVLRLQESPGQILEVVVGRRRPRGIAGLAPSLPWRGPGRGRCWIAGVMGAPAIVVGRRRPRGIAGLAPSLPRRGLG